ncbi:MAG: hypothetical protein HY690_10065 [Chloroflexi bacterium]|nr:hypothetical protein [Chloroflexota bacterium]
MDFITIGLILGLVATLALVWSVLYAAGRTEARPAGVDRQALDRAEHLVQTVLSDQEHQQLQEQGYLELPSRLHQGRRYRIPARPGLVEQLDPGGRRRLLCLVPLVTLPEPELVLVHKLWIEADEEQYLRLANRIPLWPDTPTWRGLC